MSSRTSKKTASSHDKRATPSKQLSSSAAAANNTAAREFLLDRLRILLSRLQTTTEILQNWPETQGDSAKVHAETATELIASIRKVILGVRSVERHVNGTGPSSGGAEGGGGISKEASEAFRTSLEDKCPIPLDLLDLLDVGQPFGLNPQCYARGLMKESMRQLAGLERRKRALDMLATAIEAGMEGASTTGTRKELGDDRGERGLSHKRKRDDLYEAEMRTKAPRAS